MGRVLGAWIPTGLAHLLQRMRVRRGGWGVRVGGREDGPFAPETKQNRAEPQQKRLAGGKT